MPLAFVTTLLSVALDEGSAVSTYARAIGVHRTIMSRHLRALGDRARTGGPGLGLVTVEPHPAKPRQFEVRLTQKGRLIAQEILLQMRKGLTRNR